MTTSTPSPFDVFAYQRALRDSGLPPTARLVAFVLSTYASRKDGCAWPSQETLAEGTGWSRRSVVSALATLTSAGWVTRVQTGTQGRSTRYQLHVPQGGEPSGEGSKAVTPVRTSPRTSAQVSAPADVVRCAGTPSGEPTHEEPTGRFLAPPGDLPAEVWAAAQPVFDGILGRLGADVVARFADDWGTLAKARNFAWTLATLTGQRRDGRGSARWSADDLADALTAVPLDDVAAPARALYARLMRLSEGAAPVPNDSAPGVPRPRAEWVAPSGAMGDVIAALADKLAMPEEYRSGTTSR
jgi:hypothetical protein